MVDLGVDEDDFVMYQWIIEEMTSIWCGQGPFVGSCETAIYLRVPWKERIGTC